MADTDWSRTSFSLAIITAYSNDSFQFFKMAARFVDVSESQIEQFLFYFLELITSAILLKELVTSGSANIAIVTLTSSL